MSISSSDFGLLCRTNTAWWSKKEILFPIAQNNLKLCQKWCRHTEDPWLEYIESIFVDFKNVSDRFCLYNEHLTPFFATGGTFNSIILLWPNYLVFFGQNLLFSLSTSFLGLPLICNPRSFLHPFFFASLFLFSLTLHCCISRLPGWKEFRWRPPLLFPSSADPWDSYDPPNPLDPRDPRDPPGPQDPSDHKTYQAQHHNQTRKTL